jgi:hypothetical protein
VAAPSFALDSGGANLQSKGRPRSAAPTKIWCERHNFLTTFAIYRYRVPSIQLIF